MPRPLLLLTVLFTLAFASPAAADDLFTLDADAVSPGRVIQDGGGNAYVGWIHDAAIDQPTFCKIPPGGTCTNRTTLPIPNATSIVDEVSGVFPVFGAGEVVYVVAPRYVRQDVIVWKSGNGGQNFGPGVELEDGYPSKTNPTNVLLSGSEFLISAHNAGLGFGRTPLGGSGGNFNFENTGDGSVAGSSMASDGTNLVEAFWRFADPYTVAYYRYKGSGAVDSAVNWEGPTEVSNGYEPRLAGGSGGVFMVSQDYAGGANPTAVNVRRISAGGVSGPATLVNDSQASLYLGGAIAQSPAGRVAVAWPLVRSGDNAFVMGLWTSTDGGTTFTQSDVAHIGDAYAIGDNAQLSVGDGGQGWLTFRDRAGLRVADLTPIAGPPAPTTKPPTYKGPTKVIKKKVDGFLLTLRLPKRCLQQQQPFFAGVGVRARGKLKKKLRGKIHVLKVVFKFDGKKLSVKKKKPYRQLVKPGPLAPGSVHRVVARVKVRVTKRGKSKKIVRVLRGTVKIC
jgi:hypothetical protein